MPAPAIAFPGPLSLGRGVVIGPGDPLPPTAAGWPRLTIDRPALADPAAALEHLDAWWRERAPSTVELAVDFAELKAPEHCELPPYRLSPDFELPRERLHFLVWANRYDGRGGHLRWYHGERALALGAERSADTDVTAPGTGPVWIDGGPRTDRLGDLAVVHVETVWSGRLEPDRHAPPTAPLAPDQLAAVNHASGPARIIAPAGSGKTRVLTERLRHLVADRGWNPDAITALAYNRRAADEMRARLPDVSAATVKTLHAFGYELLGRAGGRRPRLLEEREVRRLLDELAPIRPRANEDVHAPYLEALAEVRMALRPPEVVEESRDDVPGLAALFDPYRRRMAEMGAVDHDEQIYGAVEVLLREPGVRAWAQARCRHLLVDEFQDLTPAHLLMLRLVAAPGYDVFGVGDDDQVIYGYAGASPEFLIGYHRYFPGAGHYQLEVNYRCPAPVVTAAAILLAHNRRRVPKVTRSADTGLTGLEIEAYPQPELGLGLVELVRRLGKDFAPTETAVLARVNVGLLVPQICLAEAGIPVRPALDAGLLGRSGVRAALAWLRLGQAAAAGEPLAGSNLAEATRRPPRGLSPGVRGALGRGAWTLDRLAGFASGSSDDRTRLRLESLVDDLEVMAGLVSEGGHVADQLTALRDRLGLGSALERLDGARSAAYGSHGDDLDALIVLAHTHPTIDDFEGWLRRALERRPDSGDGVTLSTVHRVKGLEWPAVIVWDASSGLMPHRLAGDGEEERRIFHVALTRGSRSVTVVAREGKISPFIGELTTLPTAPAEPEADRAVVSPSSGGPDPALLDRLRDWRRRRAAGDGVPAYVIAHDAHLESIAHRRPGSLRELAACDGIGPGRLERYGEDILEVVEGQPA